MAGQQYEFQIRYVTEKGRAGDWSARSGYEIGLQLARRPEVTAVFCANDHMALGLLRAFHEAGRHVPAEVSVVGFDDIPESSYFTPPLSTVRQDFTEVGHRAIAILQAAISDPDPDADIPERLIQPELVVRSSTAALGRPKRKARR